MKKRSGPGLLVFIIAVMISCNENTEEAICENFTANPSSVQTSPGIKNDLAVSQFSVGYADLNCGEILANGIYNNIWFERDYNYRNYFLDYLYYQDFQSKEDVLNSGYSASIPIPELGGALVDASGNFDYRRYREWRSSYQVKHVRETVMREGVKLMQQKIDESVISAWISCKTLQASQTSRGMFGVLQPIDESYAELTVFYIPDPRTGVSSASFSQDVKIGGGVPSCSNYDQFKAGATVETRVKKLRLKRKPDELLSVEMYFSSNARDTILYLPPPPVGTLLNFFVKENKTYIDDSVTLLWDIVNSNRIELDGRRVARKDSARIKVQEKSRYVLQYEYKKDSLLSDTLIVVGTVKPPTLVNAQMLFVTPMWADGKNNDNSHVEVEVTLTDIDGRQIVGKGNFGNGTEIAPNQELTMSIVFNANEASAFELTKLRSVYYVTRFAKPDGRIFRNDHWTYRAELSLNFTQGKSLFCGYNEPAQQINFGPEWRPISASIEASRIRVQRTLIRPYL